ncbi:MAG: hypothetical protein HY209_01205 [Candidatus Omnitrophica bacterium]|nr:hypothetical protein [Candidatus Omnitrophota bacterium]
MKRTNKIVLFFLTFSFFLPFLNSPLFASEEIITVAAENPQGTTLDLKKGEYVVKITGGAITLFYPINPNYHWLVAVAVGTDVKGNQDDPNLGTIYFEPKPPVFSQAQAEEQALKATKDNLPGTFLKFKLKENKKVRFWVSDFDYSDNSGMVKLKINSVSK